MILDTVTKKLQVVLTTANTTLDMPVFVSYTDESGTSKSKGSLLSTTSGLTTVDICRSPDQHTSRTINSIEIYNRDTASKIVQIYVNDGGSQFQLQDVTLAVDDVLGYTDTRGWYVQDGQGNIKSTSTVGAVLSTSPSAGIGYATGAGGSVIQITNRSTGVTLNTVCGSIQTDTTSLAAGASAEFVVTNSRVAIGDVVVVSQRSGSSNVAGVAGVTHVSVVTVAAGSFILSVDNKSTTTAEVGAIVINFAIIKAVTA